MLLQYSPVNTPMRVVQINGTPAGTQRVQELGLLPGTVITVLRRAPFGGPLDVLVGRVRVGIRPDEHLQITVEPLAEGVA
jgi:ferrous iron transport protein A